MNVFINYTSLKLIHVTCNTAQFDENLLFNTYKVIFLLSIYFHNLGYFKT